MDKAGEIDIERYLVKPGKEINLSDYSTICDVDINKNLVKAVYFPQILEDLSLLQAKLYAQSS